MKKFLGDIFKDENKKFSSNRFVGIMCALSLCVTMYHNQFSAEDIAPAPALINAVAALAFGALGLGKVNQVFGKKDKVEE